MEPTFVDEMGIKASLTPSRSNGFLNMFKRVQDEARSLTEGA
ncbi:MAG: SufE family protein [Candidatus Thermoplasmatota archaeon]|nr:SufE family protein [Candidatus Thermoplasmatota archaeon]